MPALLDGTPFKDRQMIVALGIGCDARKTVLGLREGATENAAVVNALRNALANIGVFPLERLGGFLIEPNVAQDLCV